jgi:non-canonical (house-cleaning) NTP pyrophosphatase
MQRIILASTSWIKAEAVQEVFPDCDVTLVSSPSGINEQPRGLEETYLGAMNRLKRCPKGDTDCIIAIENGLVKLGDHYLDIAVIVAESTKTGEMRCVTSMGTPFPAEFAKQAFVDPSITAGSRMAKSGLTEDRNDPHTALTVGKFTRKGLLVEAMKLMMSIKT